MIIHRYTWTRGNGQNEQNGLTEYIAIEKRPEKSHGWGTGPLCYVDENY